VDYDRVGVTHGKIDSLGWIYFDVVTSIFVAKIRDCCLIGNQFLLGGLGDKNCTILKICCFSNFFVTIVSWKNIKRKYLGMDVSWGISN